ncbi:unnamed protein product [Boreogadus saida]
MSRSLLTGQSLSYEVAPAGPRESDGVLALSHRHGDGGVERGAPVASDTPGPSPFIIAAVIRERREN